MSVNTKTFLMLLFCTFCNSFLAWVIISLYEALRGALDLNSNMAVFCLAIGAVLTFLNSDN